MAAKSNPQFPLYIPSKGRSESRLTSKALESMGVPYHIVIEEQEYEAYAEVIDPKKILILDKQYQDDYDTFDLDVKGKSKGSGPARNFIWDHAQKAGAPWHWIMDDNIQQFSRFNNNLIIRLANGVGFKAMEDFCLRYKNISMAGPNYEMFVPRKVKQPPFVTNTRIYSCNLIRTDLPFRWRCRYNEDTDLSLRMLKAGWCTVLFNAFLQLKTTTLLMKGGNTDEVYAGGTLAKSKMQVATHPDVATLVWKFNRWHHYVDYSSFKDNALIPKDGIRRKTKPNEYGLKLRARS